MAIEFFGVAFHVHPKPLPQSRHSPPLAAGQHVVATGAGKSALLKDFVDAATRAFTASRTAPAIPNQPLD
jgi:hypothetical protein